ncbi:fungal-specific transcription factor domain-containing protein [Penicillium brevicompactum]|uniref:Fungal-specific transcription factor domain-containing protein n=1 Tax=Penicillium brevicompactum TaxID=5074 RepID=A0A9W9R6P3_PENBR|nr:fungal-specific transcription factor domain-containing protein [Penicillium brevicompactum]
MDFEEASLPALRSCHRCNQKKIRCNKAQPCNNCTKSDTECLFPGPGRAPRRKKRPLKAELVSRLKGLENHIQSLTQKRGDVTVQDALGTHLQETPAAEQSFDNNDQRGQLLVKGDSSQYVTHEVLIGLEHQIGELKELVEAPENESTAFMDGIEEQGVHNGSSFLFGYSSMADSLEAFHPSVPQSQTLWATYEQNVSPVVMIFHKPSLLRLVHKVATNNAYVDRPSEAVVFAVYFAAVNSMKPEQCKRELGRDHISTLQHYRFATEQALARAGFLQSRNQTVLQAAVLFFTCLRRPGDAHFVWTITAALCRLAQGMGLHRDGTKFGLTPFELEMRRRLWWSVYLLDSQSSELHAIDTQIAEGSYDTQFPLNINDADLSAESTQTPEPHSGFTDMSFCLVRIEMIVSHRRSTLGAPGCERNEKVSAKATGSIGPNAREERLRDLATIHNRLRDRYLQFCDMSEPTQWVTATVIRLALTRSWMIAHLVSGETPGQDPLTEIQTDDPQRDQIFSTAIEVIEFAYLLETDPRTTKWSWFFEAYPQWHAVTIVLSELCVRPQAAETDRAWAVVDKAISRWTERGLQKGGITLEIIYQLMSRAAVVHGRVWSS